MYACLDLSARTSCRRSKIALYENADEYARAYLNEHSGFSNLLLANFRSIFLFYFGFCLLVFVAFGVPRLVQLTKKIIQRKIEGPSNPRKPKKLISGKLNLFPAFGD